MHKKLFEIAQEDKTLAPNRTKMYAICEKYLEVEEDLIEQDKENVKK